jgi:AcrR family transcriptional regulator
MAVSMTAVRPRRTQAERSATTRAQVLDAAVACLFELGYARTSTTEIAERAGVSRGAQLHHFPTKAELVTAAVEHLFERRHQEFVTRMATLPAGADRAASAIDLLWSMFSGPTFYAWLELAVAARTDPELRAAVGGMSERFRDTIDTTFARLFPAPRQSNSFHAVAPHFVFALMDGLALSRIFAGDDSRRIEVLNALKGLSQLVLPPARE